MKQTILLLLLLCSTYLFAQDTTGTSCGQKKATENLFLRNPELRALHEQIEARLYEYNRTKQQRGNESQHTNAVVYLPVVVHIIHNNGPENISNAQVQTAIQHLNEAYANSGYYNPADGVNTEIQFCLAKRDPAGNATNGIDRVVSPLTVMNGWQDYSVDLAVKNLSRWDPRCYINIWVVGDITGGVAGYAYLPSAHGSNVDGIVLEARYFGTSYPNDVVVIHEMGHYLGLYHTFEGGCSNTDCATTGDRVCDTPPDQSTVAVSCNSSVNSCTTDALSGFSTDQNDLKEDYMDYGNWNCMKVFTQGQSDRMNWIIQNVRRSLLNCRSCQDPCPVPVVANFTSSANNIPIGTLVNFTNTSANAAGYRWYINGALQSTATNYSYTFNTAGTFVIKLTALPGSALCDSTFKYDTIRVTCPVTAGFTPLSTSANTNVTVNFTNSSTGATSYAWYVNGALQGTGLNFSYAFTTAGNYVIKMKAMNGNCADSIGGTVVITDTCIRQTFQKTYGGAGDDVAYDIRSTTDGGYIMAGKTNSFGAGAYDGYVVKMDNQGVIEWSRVYGGTGDDYINRILQTPDGGFVMVGQTKSYNNPAGDAWVIKTDGVGTIQWAKRFGEHSTFGEQGIIICTTSDGGYAFVGSQNAAPATSNVLVVKLDANGNVQWSRVYDSGNTDGGGGTIVEDNGVLVVTAFTRTSLSYHDGLVMKILMSNGNLQWMRRYEVDGRNNFGGELFKVGNGYRFHLPSIQDFSNLNTGRNITLTLDTDGVATGVRQLVPPDFGNGPILIMPDGSEIAVYNEQNTTSEFNIMKVSGSNSIQWAKKYVRAGPQINYQIRASQDGGFITIGASNPSSNNDIYVAKVDVQGNSPGCDTARINVAIQTPPFSSDLFNWAIQRPANFTNPLDIVVTNNAATTSATALCTGSTCVDTIPVDTCNGYTFLKLIGRSTNGFNAGYTIKKISDGGMIIAGTTGATMATSDALLVRLNAKGDIIWSKTYGTSGEDAFIDIISTSDGNYVAAGMGRFNTSHRTDAWLMKFDPNGNVIWSKSYGAGTANGERIYRVAQTDDGGFVMAANYNWSPSTMQALYLRADANGNLLWSRLMGGTEGTENAYVVAQGDFFFGNGVVTKNATTTFNDAFLVKMRLSDGSLVWTRTLESQLRGNRFDHMTKKNNELTFSMFNVDSWTTGNFTPLIVKTDTNGNVIYSRSYEVTGLNRNAVHTVVHPTPDGGAITSLSELGGNTAPRLAKVAANGAVTWSNSYGTYQSHVLWSLDHDSEGYVVSGQAVKQAGNQQILLFKSRLTGALSGTGTAQNCPVTPSAAVDNNIPVASITQNASYWNITSGNIQNVVANPAVADITLTVETPCIDTTNCDPPPPPDTCNQASFVKMLSRNGVTQAHDVQKTPDGGMILVGITTPQGSNFSDAVIIRLDPNGNVVWSKTYATSGNDGFFTCIATSDGNYVASGYGKFNASHRTDAVVMKFDINGNTIWQKSWGAGTTFGEIANIIAQTEDGGYIVAVDYNTDPSTVKPAYLRLDANGNLIWSKLMDGINTGQSLAVVPQGDYMFVAGGYSKAGTTFGDGYIVKMRISDGSLLWTRRIESQGRSNRLTRMQMNNGELYFPLFNYDSWATGNFTPMIVKADTSGNITYSRSFEIQGINRNEDYPSIVPTSDGGFFASVSEFAANTAPHLLKISSTGAITWSKKYSTYQSQVIARTMVDSKGYVAAGWAVKSGGGNQPLLVIRTTPTGALQGPGSSQSCPVTTTTATDNNILVQSLPQPANFWTISSGNIVVQTTNFTIADIIFTVETPCIDTADCDPPPPPDTCNQTSFVKLLGRPGTSYAFDVLKTPDGGMIVAGNTRPLSGPEGDAIIVRLDSKGNTVWSKTYGTPGNDGIISMIQTRDGNYVASGYGRFNASHRTDALIMKFDINGNIIWSKSYGAGTSSGEQATTLAETDDGGFFIAVNYNTNPTNVQPVYLRLDANGNLLWSRQLGVTTSGEALSAVVQGDYAYGGGVTARAGNTFNDGYIVKMRLSDGTVLWTRRIESQNRSNRLDRLRMKDGQLYFPLFNFDSWLTGNFTPMIVKADTSGNITYSRSFEIQGLNRTTDFPTIVPTSDGGFLASVSELVNNTAPRLAKIAPGGTVTWSKKYSDYQTQGIYRTIADSSGYVAVGYAVKPTGGNQHLLIMRTKLTGTLDGPGSTQSCPVTETTATDNNILVESLPQGPAYWNISSGNMQSQTTNVTVTDITLNAETPCIDTADCDPPPPPDTCNDVTYIKNYASSDSSETFHQAISTPDNYLLVVGHTVSSTINGVLIKMRKDGSIVWQKKFDVTSISQVIVTSDNNYLLGGVGNAASFLAKIDPAGNVIWKTQISSINGYEFGRVIEGSDGNYYTAGRKQPATNGSYAVTKVSPLGAIVWIKSYAPPANVQMAPYDLADDGAAIMVAGQYDLTDGSQNKWGFVSRINKNDGTVIYSNSYHLSGGRNIFTQINKLGSDFVLTGLTQDYPFFNSFFRINAAGNLLKVRSFSGWAVNGYNNTSVLPSGEILSTNRYATFNPANPYMLSMYKLDSGWNPIWMKRYTQLPSFFNSNNVFQSGTNIYVVGTTARNGYSIGTVTRFTQHGELISCPSDTFNLWYYDVLPVNFNVTPFTHSSIANVSLTPNTTLPILTASQIKDVETRCYGTVGKCDTLDITGEDTVCNLIDTLHFRATRDSTCTSTVQWSIDTAYGKIISYTDSTVDIKFKRTGTVYLYGTIVTPCKLIRDSMLISVFDFPDTVNLGPDLQLCAISVITLNAGGGFASYKWNTGATDSTLTVDQPGTYSVEAFDLCGNVLRDTVVITVAPPIPFDLGPDLAVCNKDTLTITAPAGFTRYTWADNYNISSRYTQSVRVWPSADTTYSVIAETTLGCLVYDSIRVTVKTAPPINIGADTSFCQNDSATLTATPGFNDYTWNTGATTQQITVKNKGIYYIRATAPNGCIAKDTMEVRSVFALPILDIGKDTLICKDNSYTFDAGNHASYLWHDGSTGRRFTATQIGQVWVQVMSDSGCVSSDTAHILRIAAPPTNFLDTAAEFCPYEKATLFAKGIFVRYRWSTGSVSPTMETNIPGTYWLEVTNADGCTNREYINVKTKICRTAIDFPNAFTPNNDRRNETYKPIVRGLLLEYKFTIYNRWGQRVFETTDPNRAWDGTIAGKPQDSGGFVWVCRYQFAGEEMKMAKGTLLLIR